MITHGYFPSSFTSSTIIPVIKNKKASLNDSSNYRPVTLSSIVGKLMDIVIIEKQKQQLQSSDLQFGFKEKSSTVQCTFVMNEVINYYLQNDSIVYATYLDASKAFDCVKYENLFCVLLSNDICPTIARFLAFMYHHQQCCVKWSNSKSSLFSISNGVKQGGVLSPLLFNLYIDVLLHRLAASGFGCHIGNVFYGALAYADDIVLLCPSIAALNHMLAVCEKFSDEYSIKFNATKSKLIAYGDTSANQNVIFQGHSIPVSDYEKHVGNLVGSNSNIDNDIINNAKCDMYMRLNLLLRQLGKCDCFTIYPLFKNFACHFMEVSCGTTLVTK